MAIKDIHELNEKYIEGNTYRAFLYTPANVFAGELDLIAPRLSLKKDGFDLLDFSLSAKLFDLNELALTDNPFIDYTLDGYYIVMQFGDLTSNDYDERRFVIKNRNSNLEDEAASFSYTAISSEFELQKLPVINWPGVEVQEYKDISDVVTSVEDSLNPTLLDGSITGYNPIQLRHTPKDEKIFVSRVHTVYKIEIPLFETSVGVNELNKMGANEYYYDRQNDQIITWLPAHLNLPTSPAGEVNFNDPVDSYQFFIYYQTTDEINTDEEDENTDIIEGEFEKAYFYNTDGLTINQILEDVFQILSTEDSNLRFFTQWTYNKAESIESSEIRSDINFSNTTVYDMLKSLEENYQLYIEFDTISREVILRERFSGQNRGLRFEYGKYLNGVSQEYNTDELITYMQGQDANNIGFADVSWSGDNYVENYDYYLDGVTWAPQEGNPDGILTGASRWITADLARVLGKIKYYQEFYEAEVWGDENANPQKKGIANIRFELQEQLNEIDFEIIELEKEIQIKEAALTNYTNEEPSQKLILDNGVKRNPANITSEEIVSGVRFDIDLNISANKANNIVTATRNINGTTPVTFRSFRLKGSDLFKVISIGGIEREIGTKDLITNIRVDFFNGSTKVKTVFLTAEDTNKEIPLNASITATSFDIRLSVEDISLKVDFKVGQSFEIKSLSIFEAEFTKIIYPWDTYDQYLNSLILDLQGRKNSLEIQQHLIKNGTVIGFNSTNVINENNIYDATVDNPNAIGIGQIELRLDYIRTLTSVNHESLDTNVLNELKLIRKGAVYSNNDIRNSKTLFIAARDELKEKIYPMITVDISSVSLLQTYEAFEDWKKFKIGEKVDIFVPQLRINIEAEIQELDFDFQSYQTSVKISTVRNYDKSFGRIFSNTFLLANKTSKNEVQTLQKPNEKTRRILERNGRALESLAERPDLEVGFEGLDPLGEASNIRNIFQGSQPKENDNVQFDMVSLKAKFIDLATDTLVDEIPVYYDSQKTRGAAEITNGGVYIKDPDGEVRIKMNSADGLVGYKTESGVTTESFKIDLDGNATFAGELQAASGSFGEVSIAPTGKLTIGDNITINDSGITAVDGNDNQTLLISSNDGSIFIRGTIQEGTVFESILTREINVTGGTRIVNYDADNTLPDDEDPNDIMGDFIAQVFANGIDVSNNANTLYSWSVEGLLDVTGVTTNTKTFSPKIATTYSNQPTQIILNVTYSDSIVIQEIIPINITKDGIQGINGFNQAQIYLYKRVSGTAPTNVGTIAGGYIFDATTIPDGPTPNPNLTTNSDSWSLTIPAGSDPLYVSVGTVKSQANTVNFTEAIFSGPVKLVEDGADGTNGLNVATVYIYLRSNTEPSSKPIGNTTFTFDPDDQDPNTGGISFADANGWSGTIPTTGGTNLWVRIATAASTGPTDIIADTEWSEVGLIAPKGDDGVDAKVVNLTASTQAIVLNADATVNGEQSVVFTTETQGAIGATSFTFSPDVSANFTLGTKTLTFADNATHSFPITVTFGDGTTQDTLTIIGVKPGADGDDAVNAFLTNESHIVQADSAGTVLSGEFDLATTDIVIFIGLTNDTANWSISRTASEGITLSAGGTFPITTMTVNTGTITITASKTDFSPVVKTFTITKSRQGIQGETGPAGLNGPGVVFRGLFDSSVAYFHTDSRRDIVQNGIGGSYFITNNLSKNGLTTWGSPTTSDWEAFGQEFSSVATDILLAQNATITRGLVIGESSPTNNAFIRSAGKTGLDTGAGFYLNDNGSFNFGDSDGSNIDWDGSVLNIKGNLNIEKPYYSYSAQNAGGVKASNLSTNLSPYTEDHETYFDITLTTGTINAPQTTKQWEYILVNTAPALIWDGNSLPDPTLFNAGDTLLWEVDDSYYQIVEVSGVTTIDLVVKSKNQGTGTTYKVPLLVEVDGGVSYYRSRSYNIAHLLATVGPVDVYFYSIFSTNGYIEAADLTPQTITVKANAEDQISNLFDLVLASSGVGAVVSSINGLTGDVEIATGGSVTSADITDATSVGQALVKLANATTPGDYFLRYSFDNTNHSVEALSAESFRSAIGAGTSYNTATTTASGLVRLGVAAAAATVNTATTTAGRFYHVGATANGNLYVNVPWVDTNTEYSNFEGASIGSGIPVGGSAGLVPGPSGADINKFLKGDGTWASTPDNNTVTSIRRDNTGTYRTGNINLVGGTNVTITETSTGVFSFAATDTNTEYVKATSSVLGLVKIGFQDVEQSKQYGVQLDNDGKMFVNVPWVDTNTVYTHPTHPGDDINIDTGALTGATVISDLDFNITTDTEGHVTDANATIATRNLTAANVGAVAKVGGDTMEGPLNITHNTNSLNLNSTSSPYLRFDLGGSGTTGDYRIYSWGSSRNLSIESMGDVSINIDYNNNQTNKKFSVRHNGEGGSGGTELFRVQEDGKVGIGTTDPGEKLEVVGTVKATNVTVGTNNVWHAGNDGSGSGLDADKTDGKHILVLTLASYNAITTKDPNTLYFIT